MIPYDFILFWGFVVVVVTVVVVVIVFVVVAGPHAFIDLEKSMSEVYLRCSETRKGHLYM